MLQSDARLAEGATRHRDWMVPELCVTNANRVPAERRTSYHGIMVDRP
jgi:hypothetical protein